MVGTAERGVVTGRTLEPAPVQCGISSARLHSCFRSLPTEPVENILCLLPARLKAGERRALRCTLGSRSSWNPWGTVPDYFFRRLAARM